MTALNRVASAAAAAQGSVLGANTQRPVRRRTAALGTAALRTGLVASLASPALAANAQPLPEHLGLGSDPAVFVQTDNTAGPVGTDAGTVDSAASPDGRFLYAETGGAGIVDEFAVSPAGALTELGSGTVPGAVGGEGILVG